MASTGPNLGRFQKLAVSTNGSSYTTVGKIISGDRNARVAAEDGTTHDDDANMVFEPGHQNVTMSAEFNFDDADAGQEIVFANKGVMLFWRFRMREESGDKEFIQQGFWTDQGLQGPLNGFGKMRLSIQMSGAVTEQNQP